MRAIFRVTLRRLPLILVILLFGVTSLSGEEIGTVAALGESLAIIRAGEALPASVEGGTTLEAEDLLIAGEEYGEVIVDGLGRLRLWPASVVHLRRGEEGVEIELLSGTARFRRIGGSEPATVVSGAVSVGLRAGAATVTADAADIRLVVAESGRRPVLSRSGRRRFAEPGRPVGYVQQLTSIDGSPLAWREAALSEFRSREPGEMARRFREYLELRGRFDSAYGELLTHRAQLNQWSRAYRRGLTPGVADALSENQELNAALDEVLSISEEMEARYYQLRLDAPYLAEEYRDHLRREDAFLLERLHFVRFLRAIVPADALPREGL